MTPSSCPWRTRARGPNSAGSPASGRCTSSAEPGSRWPTRTSSPGCATRTWRMMRMQPKPLRSRMGESASGQGQGFQPNVHPQLPVVLQHHQQQHPAILPCLLQLDATPFDPEEPPGSAGLLPTPAAGAGIHKGKHYYHPSPEIRTETQPGRTTEQRKISLQTFPGPCQVPCSENTELALILIAVGLEVAPSPGVSSAIFFVPGFLLLVPGVYHVIFIYCAVKGHRGFQFFYLPYFEK
ncbi:transmembrane protein 134 isoform X1 [Felis catus]|uniref:transmembrane protein 134 isoform X1 n=1 Tax=Felis catus TaxID=9685 RepID=UPI001D19C3A4|nr:transmembrane protein 134 isoform X1 [Felis catus]